MRNLSIRLIAVSLLASMVLVPLSTADREPNDSLENAEILEEGTHQGRVYYGYPGDVDCYEIPIPKEKRLNLTFSLTDRGFIQIYGFDDKDAQKHTYLHHISEDIRTIYLEFGSSSEDYETFVQLIGDGNYRVKVAYSGGGVRDKLPKLDPTLLVLPLVIVTSIIFIGLGSFLFYRFYKASKEEVFFEPKFDN